jgi:DNA-binding IscR family transcriptional regulator
MHGIIDVIEVLDGEIIIFSCLGIVNINGKECPV